MSAADAGQTAASSVIAWAQCDGLVVGRRRLCLVAQPFIGLSPYRPDLGPTTTPNPTNTTTTSSTTSGTTTAATTTTTATTAPPATTANTSQQPPAPTTPEQAIGNSRTAIAQAESSGQLDSSAADNLNHRLDNISQALQHPNPNDAAHKTSDLLNRLGDLVNAGQLTSAAYKQIATPLNQLAALLPAQPGPDHRDNSGGDNGNGG